MKKDINLLDRIVDVMNYDKEHPSSRTANILKK